MKHVQTLSRIPALATEEVEVSAKIGLAASLLTDVQSFLAAKEAAAAAADAA